MDIEVIGPGCPFYRKLHRRVREVVNEQGIEAEARHVTDFRTVIRYMPWTPVFLINGQVTHRGKLLPKKEKLADFTEKAPSEP